MRQCYAVTAVVLAAGGISACLSACSGAPATRAAPAVSGSPQYVVIGCGPEVVVRPPSYEWDYINEFSGLKAIHWTSWGSRSASGSATYWAEDGSDPASRSAKHDYPALVRFWGSAAVPGRPDDRSYTEITLTFTGQRPPVDGLDDGGSPRPATQTFSAVSVGPGIPL